jgi:DNA-binding NarL/FixJ family response regulator
MAQIRLLIVDHHAMFREALRAILERQEDMVVVGEARDASTAVRLASEWQPDVILMEAELPGRGGIETTRKILTERPAARVIALTMHDDDELIAAAIRAGVQGYLLKESRAADLVQAVRTVAAGGAAIDPTVAGRVWRQYRALVDHQAAAAD